MGGDVQFSKELIYKFSKELIYFKSLNKPGTDLSGAAFAAREKKEGSSGGRLVPRKRNWSGPPTSRERGHERGGEEGKGVPLFNSPSPRAPASLFRLPGFPSHPPCLK